MEFKRAAPKSSVFGSYLKATDAKQKAARKVASTPSTTADPVDLILAGLEQVDTLSVRDALALVPGGKSEGLKALRTMEEFGLITIERDEEGRSTIRKVPAS